MTALMWTAKIRGIPASLQGMSDMPTTTIFHLRSDAPLPAVLGVADFDADRQTAAALQALADGLYLAVAEIEGTPSDAYKVTQNGVVSDSWTLDPPPGVKPLFEGIETADRPLGLRSTSMGDIMLHQGRALLVATVGYLDLGAEAILDNAWRVGARLHPNDAESPVVTSLRLTRGPLEIFLTAGFADGTKMVIPTSRNEFENNSPTPPTR